MFCILQLALESFNKALGDGVWVALTGNKPKPYVIEASASILDYKDMQVFHRLEEDGLAVELPWNKVTVVFNLARLHEQLHNTGIANILYRLILFKVSSANAPLVFSTQTPFHDRD